MTTTPLYLNWTFWSFFVAFMALILSQLPKMSVWFKRKKIDLEIHNKMTVNHWIGIPCISLFLGITNKGQAKVKIKKESQDIANLTCNSFFETPVSESANLFFPFELLSEKSWDHSCWFTIDLDRNTEQNFRGFFSALDTNISDKIKKR